jgi:hypothetical protein
MEIASPVNYPDQDSLVVCHRCHGMLDGLRLVDGQFEHSHPRSCRMQLSFGRASLAQYLKRVGMDGDDLDEECDE